MTFDDAYIDRAAAFWQAHRGTLRALGCRDFEHLLVLFDYWRAAHARDDSPALFADELLPRQRDIQRRLDAAGRQA